MKYVLYWVVMLLSAQIHTALYTYWPVNIQQPLPNSWVVSTFSLMFFYTITPEYSKLLGPVLNLFTLYRFSCILYFQYSLMPAHDVPCSSQHFQKKLNFIAFIMLPKFHVLELVFYTNHINEYKEGLIYHSTTLEHGSVMVYRVKIL